MDCFKGICLSIELQQLHPHWVRPRATRYCLLTVVPEEDLDLLDVVLPAQVHVPLDPEHIGRAVSARAAPRGPVLFTHSVHGQHGRVVSVLSGRPIQRDVLCPQKININIFSNFFQLNHDASLNIRGLNPAQGNLRIWQVGFPIHPNSQSSKHSPVTEWQAAPYWQWQAYWHR